MQFHLLRIFCDDALKPVMNMCLNTPPNPIHPHPSLFPSVCVCSAVEANPNSIVDSLYVQFTFPSSCSFWCCWHRCRANRWNVIMSPKWSGKIISLCWPFAEHRITERTRTLCAIHFVHPSNFSNRNFRNWMSFGSGFTAIQAINREKKINWNPGEYSTVSRAKCFTVPWVCVCAFGSACRKLNEQRTLERPFPISISIYHCVRPLKFMS